MVVAKLYYDYKGKLITPAVAAAMGLTSRSGYRSSGSYTMSKRTKRRNKVTGQSLKSQIIKTHPAKHFTSAPELYPVHNTLYTMCPSMGITQGITNSQREGDSVYLEALKIKGFFHTASTSSAYQYRIIVGWSGEEVTTSSVQYSFVSGLGVTDMFLPSTTDLTVLTGIINPKAFTVLYDETIDINSQIASTVDLRQFAATIPIKSRLDYQSSGSVYGKLRNLYIVVAGYINGGTTGTTTAGHLIISTDLIYKNC